MKVKGEGVMWELGLGTYLRLKVWTGLTSLRDQKPQYC